MTNGAAVLLPVRMETRFDDGAEGFLGTRLRVLVVPDVCWYDRRAPATESELALLDIALTTGEGAILGKPGRPPTAAMIGGFDGLAAAVGPARAYQLATAFPAVATGNTWRADRDAAPHVERGPTTRVRIAGLPETIGLYASAGGAPQLLKEARPQAVIEVQPGDDGWWPSWSALHEAGLTFEVDLHELQLQPEDITSLFVVGVGTADADALFAAHAVMGDLGLLRPGAPTNSIAGAAAANLATDPAAWQALAERNRDDAEDRLARALARDNSWLTPLVGDRDQGGIRPAMIMALWGALAAHGLREIWAVPAASVVDSQLWAVDYLYPDGPLPPVRIRQQPYGVWPVTDWRRWDASDLPATKAALENRIVDMAMRANAEMASRAESGLGTVVGADNERLWELLAQTPASSAYELRLGSPVSSWNTIDPADQAKFDLWWDQVSLISSDVVSQRPDDGIIALGAPHPLTNLGFVLPPVDLNANVPLFLPSLGVDPGEAQAWLEHEPARWLSTACRDLFETLFTDVGLHSEPILEPEWMPASLFYRLLVMSGSICLDHALREQAGNDGPLLSTAPELLERINFVTLAAGNGPARDSYEQFRNGVLWLAELAESSPDGGAALVANIDRVLRGLLDTASRRVDPWLTGAAYRRLETLTNEPRPLGLYGWVDQPFNGTPGPDLEVGLLLAPSDAQARTAIVLRDKAIDSPADRWKLELDSSSIRDAVRLGDEVRSGAYPSEALGREVERLVGDRNAIDHLRTGFPVREEHAGRRTCDGLKVLDAIRTNSMDRHLQAAALSPEVISRILQLDTIIDTQADLQLAEAVYRALAGRPEAAAEPLDAIAGLGPTPNLDVLATPARGRSVRTTVLFGLPETVEPVSDQTSPVAIASPALAHWLANTTGDPAGPDWTWTGADPAIEVSLFDLGLQAVDALVLDTSDLLERVARAANAGPETITTPSGPAQVQQLASLIGNRPLQGIDLGLEPAKVAGFDRPVLDELNGRHDLLAERARALIARLEHADVAGLAEAARWGVRADNEADAAAELQARLAAAPALHSSVTAAAEALIALVAPHANFTVLVATETPFPTVGPLTIDTSLDVEWLELVAAVRPPLARLEAHQVTARWHGQPPLRAATSHPGDPWAASSTVMDHSDPKVPHVVIAYGPGLLAAGTAWSVLDTYAEVIPFSSHDAVGAFRFNAPSAQAPQAILLAVPPGPEDAIDAELVLAAVEQARWVAHGRMARSEDLGQLDVLLPVMPGPEAGGFHYCTPARKSG